MLANVSIRGLNEQDLRDATRLSQANGWNQTLADWQRLLMLAPRGCFAAVRHGEVLGTVTTTCYGPSLAWIGMMLVRDDVRRQGLGRRLLARAIEHLTEAGVRSIQLDATPLGEPLYTTFSFSEAFCFARWEGQGRGHVAELLREESPHLPHCVELDARANGVPREGLLRALARDSHCVTRSDGFGMLRPGARATYLGPVCAESPGAARDIVAQLLKHVSTSVFWDVPGTNAPAEAMAQSLGFSRVRELKRMVWGDAGPAGTASLQFAIAGPATG